MNARSASAGPGVRGEAPLAALERPLLGLDRLARRLVPDARNPFAQTGAIATTTFLIAAISGGLTLFWYSASLHQAHASVEAMSASLLGGLVRSLHRYSSDACMLFTVLHGLKLLLARRLTGPRWLSWVTGIALVGVLWGVGWLGYWLVWDERARQVALGTAQVLDVLPIFAEPLSRTFLTDGSINSLLFFMVFFLHMLVPLAAGILLWLHIVRVARPRFLTDRAMTLWIVGSLVAVSLIYPATSAAPAHMGTAPERFTMDWWYLLPLVFTERLGGGALWALTLVGGVVAAGLPWLLRRDRVRPAAVEVDKCNACQRCVTDCPYNAIEMVARPEGGRRDEPLVAKVDPDRCVGCGICAGACNSAGIGLPWIPVAEHRRLLDVALAQNKARPIAFVCAESAGADLTLEGDGSPDLPGYRVEMVPCAGWLHALTVERALRHGAPKVLVVACSEGGCRHREGDSHTAARLAGQREPFLRLEKIDPAKVALLRLDRGQIRKLRRGANPSNTNRNSVTALLGGFVLAAGTSALMTAASDAPFAMPDREPTLVVSFNHPGERGEHCRDATPEELAKLPPHMRQPRICERGRAPVRLRLTIDGAPAVDKSYAPGGLSGDGTSVAIESLTLPPGTHRVKVEIGDTLDATVWSHADERTVELTPRARRVVLFDKRTGFTWE